MSARLAAAALACLFLALPAKGQDLDALFRDGMTALEESYRAEGDDRDALLDRAIVRFHEILIADPDLLRVRLELARAFFLKEEDGLAREHFEHVLAGNPPPAVALNVNRFLSVMRARKRWSVRVGAAVAPDSNLSGRSEEKVVLIDIGQFFGTDEEVLLPFRFTGTQKKKSGIGLVAWAGGEYQYPLGPRWRLRSGADVWRREYRSREFDRMGVSAHLGPRWLIGRASDASLLASARKGWLAGEASHHDLGARFEANHRVNRRTTVHFAASRHERRYEDESRAGLDGPLTDFSVGIGWVASRTLRLNAQVGRATQRTEIEKNRNASRWVRAGATSHLPWGFTLGGSLTMRWTRYEGDWHPFVLGGADRSDLTRAFRVDLHNRAVTVAGFSPQLSMVQEKRTTNAQLHSYDRLGGELRFVRLF